MKFPKELVDRITDITVASLEDCSAAIEKAQQEAREFPGIKSFLEEALDAAIRDEVYLIRSAVIKQFHQQNKAQAGSPAAANPPKYVPSKEVAAAFSAYAYPIGGKTIGDITGDEILTLMQGQKETIRTARYKYRLLDWGKNQGVVGDKTFKQVVSEKKLKQAMKRIEQELDAKKPAMMAGD